MVLPGKPGKPTALSITHDRIALGWTKPIEGAHNIISTSVIFHAASDPSDQWKTHSVEGNPTIHIVTQLCGKIYILLQSPFRLQRWTRGNEPYQ